MHPCDASGACVAASSLRSSSSAMKRIVFDVPRWHVYLHRDARGLETARREGRPDPEVRGRGLRPALLRRLRAAPGRSRTRSSGPGLTAFTRPASSSRRSEGSPRSAGASPWRLATAVETLMAELRPQVPRTGEREAGRQRPSGAPSERACEKASAPSTSCADAMDGLAEVGLRDAGHDHRHRRRHVGEVHPGPRWHGSRPTPGSSRSRCSPAGSSASPRRSGARRSGTAPTRSPTSSWAPTSDGSCRPRLVKLTHRHSPAAAPAEPPGASGDAVPAHRQRAARQGAAGGRCSTSPARWTARGTSGRRRSLWRFSTRPSVSAGRSRWSASTTG